jgi:predicted enzyme related to lactoylglutathione lyase
MQRKRPRTIEIKMTLPRTPPTMAAVGALGPSMGVCVASPAGDVGVPTDGAWLIALAVDDIVDNDGVAVAEGSTVTVEYIVIGAVLDSPDSDNSESESTRDKYADLL